VRYARAGGREDQDRWIVFDDNGRVAGVAESRSAARVDAKDGRQA